MLLLNKLVAGDQVIGAPSSKRKVIFGRLAAAPVMPAPCIGISAIDTAAVGCCTLVALKPDTVENRKGKGGYNPVVGVFPVNAKVIRILSVLFQTNSLDIGPFKGVAGAVPKLNVTAPVTGV